jgi:UPF0755 protein
VVERPPVAPPDRRRPTPRQVRIRRTVAGVALFALLAVIGWAAYAIAGSGSSSTTTAVLPPPPKPLEIVFPEGFTRLQMASRVTAVDRIAQRKRGILPKLRAKPYLAATAKPRRIPAFGNKPRPLEGFLFPATYQFLRTTTAKQLVQKQLVAFRRNWGQLDLSYAKSKNLTPYDVLTIASMVERETVAPQERPLVAAVIYNRLHANMPLGIDATIRYALHIPGTRSLTESALRNPTPYNTRLHAGLPPTPIGNPGLASMRAAAKPARVNYLYFVRKPDKVHHFFTASYSQFQQYAKLYGY